MQSLFLASLPRSFSSRTYQLISKAVGLTKPTWTSDGEILNGERIALCDGRGVDTPFLPAPDDINFDKLDPQPSGFNHDLDHRFERIVLLLDQLVNKNGWIYKDVVQPFVVCCYFEQFKPDLKPVFIKRSVADVAYACLKKEWYYPQRAAPDNDGQRERRVVKGLVRAQNILTDLGKTLLYKRLVRKEAYLYDKLDEWGYNPKRIAYIDDQFCKKRDRVRKRKETEGYKKIKQIVDEVKSNI